MICLLNMFCIILGCFPTEGPNLNPISLGSSWLAYADTHLIGHVKSHGESDAGASLTYKAAALNTAKVSCWFL